MPIPAIVTKRLQKVIPKFQKILRQARERDENESETVAVIRDMLEAVFGWDKYEDIASEYAIGGTYCDLAVKQNNKIKYLIEVKAIGVSLHSRHLRQAVNYAASEGIAWAVLTNGIVWQIYRVVVKGKVVHQLVADFDFLEIDRRKIEDQEKLFLLCKRGISKDVIGDYYEHRQSINPFTLSAILQTEDAINLIRREVRKLKMGLKVSNDEISAMLVEKVIKRDLIDSDAGKEAIRFVKKKLSKFSKFPKGTKKYADGSTTNPLESAQHDPSDCLNDPDGKPEGS